VLLFAVLKVMEMYANTERLVLYQNIARTYFIVVAASSKRANFGD